MLRSTSLHVGEGGLAGDPISLRLEPRKPTQWATAGAWRFTLSPDTLSTVYTPGETLARL